MAKTKNNIVDFLVFYFPCILGQYFDWLDEIFWICILRFLQKVFGPTIPVPSTEIFKSLMESF